ncbi:MAG TPA: glycosyltransferase [Janthinobacterium sp.]|nr:glycosyltransferase [Janthinobacterium sp.]
MRILFVHNAYQYWGGEDAVVDAEMALLRTHGHEVHLYRRHNDELQRLSPLAAGMNAFWSKRSAAEVDEACRRFHPDLVHVHNTFPLVSPSIYWAARRRHVPVIQTLHNFRLLCPQSSFLRNGALCHDCLGKLPWRAIGRRCYRNSMPQSAILGGVLSLHRLIGSYRNRVTLYIALSAFARDRFIQAGLPAERLRIKPNFVEADGQIPESGRSGGLFVGRLTLDKGIASLLLADVLGGGAGIEVIGGGPCEQAVGQAFGARYLGFLPSAEIRIKMRAAAFLIVPSIGYEQLPTTILEAFSCGLPVIASRLGPLIGLVREKITGLLFTPGDGADLAKKIAWAHAHPADMLAMGHAARAEYEAKYTPAINYRQLTDIYRDALAAEG